MQGLQKLEVWLLDLDASEAALDAIERETPRLPASFGTNARPAPDRWRRTAHIALRLLLERVHGQSLRAREFVTSAAGKSHLPAPFAGSFSLSHSHGRALIALSPDVRVGVDLEHTRANAISEERKARILRAGEAMAPHLALPASPDAAFLQAWVRLEAVAKASGEGIGRLLTAEGVIGSPKGRPRPDHFEVADLDLDTGWYGAIAADFLEAPVPVNRLMGPIGEIEQRLRALRH